MNSDKEQFERILRKEMIQLREIFRKYKHKLRRVGGAVRVLLREVEPRDIDFATTTRYQEPSICCLTKLIKEEEHFSKQEMIKRAPELYQEFLGQYMSLAEIQLRDSTMNLTYGRSHCKELIIDIN
ncbi:hypothetical protein GQX74_009231 [Glossina fuscipes]|nr:hypothetical protein GQX74_009231 [Glossina fuscipes]